MKNKLLTFLWVLMLTSFGTMSLFAQSTIHQGSPTSFMFIPGNGGNIGTNSWVQAKYYTSGYQAPNSVGVEGSVATTFDGSGNHSHAFVKRNPNGSNQTECTTCYPSPTYNQFRPILAPKWDGSPGYEDTVIQLGCRQSYGKHSHAMIYTFVPDTVNPVLLLQYMLAAENKLSGGHDFSGNPFIDIKVTNANTGQLLNLGYYPNDYYTNFVQTSTGTNAFDFNATVNGNFGPHGVWNPDDYSDNPNYQGNNSWPYSRYFFIAPGSGGTSPRRLEMTPCWAEMKDYSSVMRPEFCPRGNANCTSDISGDAPTVVHYRWNVVAFNLTEQARQGIPVKLSLEQYGCTYTAHWSELYYTVKMVPGDVKADACNSDTAITLEVPWGFKSYLWCHGLDENGIRYPHTDANGNMSEGQTLVLNRNNEAIWPYYCCLMESYTGVPFVYKAYFKIFDLQSRVSIYQINNEDCSITFHFADSSIASKLTPTVQNGEPIGGYDTTKLLGSQYERTWLYKTPTGVVRAFPQNTHDSTFVKTFTAAELQEYAYVGLYIENAEGTCNTIDTGWVRLMPDSSYVEGSEGRDTIITCEERIVYDPGTFGDFYTWTSPGTRTVTYPGATIYGCDSLVKVTYIMQQPKVNEVIPSVEYCDEFSTTLSVDATVDPVAYRWAYYYQSDTTFEEGVDNTAPTVTVTRPGTYSVTITDQSGCEASGEVTIDPCEPFINLPSAITPSRPDGLNDCIEVVQRSLLESLEFAVYTRTGELVYYTKDKDFCWDGTVNGKLYTNVTYIYVLRVKDYNGKSSMFKGTVLVL